MSKVILGGKRAAETVNEVFDFTSRLAAGETLSTATVTATVYSGTDTGPSAVISGAASISGAKVTQKVTAGTLGVMYLLSCSVTTSAGQTLVMEGILPIVPGLS